MHYRNRVSALGRVSWAAFLIGSRDREESPRVTRPRPASKQEHPAGVEEARKGACSTTPQVTSRAHADIAAAVNAAKQDAFENDLGLLKDFRHLGKDRDCVKEINDGMADKPEKSTRIEQSRTHTISRAGRLRGDLYPSTASLWQIRASGDRWVSQSMQ
jgi:hypothetical protein